MGIEVEKFVASWCRWGHRRKEKERLPLIEGFEKAERETNRDVCLSCRRMGKEPATMSKYSRDTKDHCLACVEEQADETGKGDIMDRILETYHDFDKRPTERRLQFTIYFCISQMYQKQIRKERSKASTNRQFYHMQHAYLQLTGYCILFRVFLLPSRSLSQGGFTLQYLLRAPSWFRHRDSQSEDIE